VEAVGAARAPHLVPQVLATVVMVVVVVAVAVAIVVVAEVVAVAVVVGMRLLSIEPQLPEVYVIFIGPLEPAIAASTACSSTRQKSRLRLPHNPQIIPPTFSR
jgi:hypothetical protein